MSPVRSAWLVVAGVIGALPELPYNGKGIQEKVDGNSELSEDGVWVFAFTEDYAYSNTGVDDKPLSSKAQIILGIQAHREFLDGLVENLPQQAMMEVTHALRRAIEQASEAFTFREANPSFACKFLRSEQLFADAIGLGVIQVTLELSGFNS